MKKLGAIFLVLFCVNAVAGEVSDKIDAAQAPFNKYRAQVDVFRNCASAMNDQDQNRIQDRCDEKKIMHAAELAKEVEPDLKNKCPDGAKDYLCGMYFSDKENIKTSFDTIERLLKGQEHSQTPEGIKESACNLNERIAKAQAVVDHEKEVGKTSGIVDAATLHGAGTSIVNDKHTLEALKKAYKEKTKKELSLKDCDKLD